VREADKWADAIEAALREAANPVRATGAKAYLKSELEFLGVSVPATRSVVKAFIREHPDLERGSVGELAEALWAKPIHERRMAAIEILDGYAAVLEPEDLGLIERLLREARTWALVDNLAANVAGGLVERFPELTREMDRWAKDADFWIRRSALLSQLLPLRAGRGDFERFARYADAMLDEEEFFIRKAVGWVLRETGKQRPDLVYDWLAPRTHRASGVTVREAVKRLAPDQAEELLKAYAERRPAR
jgi:3-methyladenine DNA glycosylase AlkD